MLGVEKEDFQKSICLDPKMQPTTPGKKGGRPGLVIGGQRSTSWGEGITSVRKDVNLPY